MAEDDDTLRARPLRFNLGTAWPMERCCTCLAHAAQVAPADNVISVCDAVAGAVQDRGEADGDSNIVVVRGVLRGVADSLGTRVGASLSQGGEVFRRSREGRPIRGDSGSKVRKDARQDIRAMGDNNVALRGDKSGRRSGDQAVTALGDRGVTALGDRGVTALGDWGVTADKGVPALAPSGTGARGDSGSTFRGVSTVMPWAGPRDAGRKAVALRANRGVGSPCQMRAGFKLMQDMPTSPGGLCRVGPMGG